MQSKLQTIEVEPLRRRDDDLAVDDAAGRQPGQQGVVQLGKVTVQRPQTAALNVAIVFAAEDERTKAVPLRLVKESALGGQRLGQFREHRLDRRLDWVHGCAVDDCRFNEQRRLSKKTMIRRAG